MTFRMPRSLLNLLSFFYFPTLIHFFFLTLLLNASWGCSQARYEVYEQTLPPSSERLEILHSHKDRRAYQKAGSLSYQRPLGVDRQAFVDLFGEPDVDDPLGDFHSYLMDPVNWDPSAQIEQRFVYGTNIGLQQQANLFGDNSIVRIGLRTRAEEAQVTYVSTHERNQLSLGQATALTDFAYAPYVTFESQPVQWMKFIGDGRANILHYDVHNVCRITCSLEPNGAGHNIVPTLKGSLIVGPWVNTDLFLNLGTGFHSFDEREPLGSTTAEQFSQATTYEVGIRTQPKEGLEFTASLWRANLDTDLVFLNGGEETISSGSSKRLGLNFGAHLNTLDWLAVSGGLTISQAKFQETDAEIPLSPNLTSYATLKGQWGNGWSSTLHMRHIGQRADSENPSSTLPAITTFDLINHYSLPISPTKGRVDAFLGMLNITNNTGQHTQFFFDSQLGTNQAPIADLHYFPGQPRMVVGGFSWRF